MFVFASNQAEVITGKYKINVLICFYAYNIYRIKYIKILQVV